MKISNLIASMILIVALSAGSASAQRNVSLGDNGALRYWAAFAQMQDSAITDWQAKEVRAILDGTAPYDDVKYKDLIEKNKLALEIMAHGAVLPKCDWGLDYDLGVDTPVDYARNAIPLGRLNVLYAFYLLQTGDKDGAVHALASGLRFAHDVANGGTLFATLIAKSLIVAHLKAVDFALHSGDLSASQRSALQKSVAALGPDGLDWQSAMRREMSVLNRPPWQAPIPLGRITQAYLAALSNPSMLPKLEGMLADTPQPLRDVIPGPKRLLEEKQDLTNKLQQTRVSMQ
jgi:hypothetical protein